MKHYIPAIFFVMISCKGETDQTNISDPDSSLVTSVADSLETNQFTIFEFPERWYKITESAEHPEQYAIIQKCNAETEQITIETGEYNERSFTFNFGQENMSWKLTNFTATSVISKEQDYVEGSFTLIPEKGTDVTADAIDFYWDRSENFCDFKGEVIGENRFVNEEAKDLYKFVEEECDDLTKK